MTIRMRTITGLALPAAVLALAACATGAAQDTPTGQGVWLKGDLHIHSRHSHDSSNNPISKIIALGEAAGMDFLAITDHDNHVEGDVANHTWADPEFASDSITLLYGAEWTTHRGHGTPLAAAPYDHQRFYDVRDARDVDIGKVKDELGLHLSANHPSGGDPFGFSYDLVDSIEVWNSARWSRNAHALIVWDDMLKSGRMLTGRGGSDSHHGSPDTEADTTELSWQAPVNNVGTPTTWVYAKDRSAQAVIDALTNGHASISANPNAPRVELVADVNGDGEPDMMMGENAITAGGQVNFQVWLTPKPSIPEPYTVRVIRNGEEIINLVITPYGGDSTSFKIKFVKQLAEGLSGGEPLDTTLFSFADTPNPEQRTYYRVEVEGPIPPYPEVPDAAEISAPMLAVSNPLYFNFDPDF